jgi:hypothetical protein
MMRICGILALAASFAGCVATSPYGSGYGYEPAPADESGPGYYEPGYYAPRPSIGVGVGGGNLGGGVGVGVGVGF